MLVASSGLAAEISGIPRIVDGDTVQIGPIKIRFAASTRQRRIKSALTPRASVGPVGSLRATSS
jgi:hypothetical protein